MPGMGGRPGHPDSVAVRAKQERAFQYRLAGMTFQEIANADDPNEPGKKLYGSRGAARNAYLAAVKRHSGESTSDELIEVENFRYDRLLRALWAKCLQGDTWSIDRALRIMDQRARLLGLNKPVKQQLEVITESAVDAAIRELEAQVAATAAEVAGVGTPDGRGPTGEAPAPPGTAG